MTANIKVGNLTDLQLRQQISQLSASQYYTSVANPTPQRIATPTAAASTATRRSHSAAPAAAVYPYAQAAAAAAAGAPTAPVPMRRTAGPALPTTPQAAQTTYASRLRTGTTLLMQPILAGSSSTAAAVQSARPRRGGVVSYAEPGSGDELPDVGELESEDDKDFMASGGLRTSVRALRAAAGPTGTPRAVPAGQPSAKTGELDQTYLGGVPPARFISAKPAAARQHEMFTEEQMLAQAQEAVAPVPIRVEFETDTHRVRDCFVWDARERLLTPEAFAKTFCADLDLAPSWADTVAAQIRAQLEESEQIAGVEMAVDSTQGAGEAPECRVILSIDVQIDNHHLLDHIEWDLRSTLAPEMFATQLCRELGLAGEAAPLVAHAIHEELLKHKKDALEWGVLGGSSESNASTALDVAAQPGTAAMMKDKTGLGMGWSRAPREVRGPRVLRSVWRDWQEAEEFGTRWEELTAEEVERREIERERASRRLRRETSKFQSSTRTRRR